MKIERVYDPKSSEKYLSLTLKEEFAVQDEFKEDSELLEDLFKILPLTIDTNFDQSKRVINCQFDTQTDLAMAQKILGLIFVSGQDSEQTVRPQRQTPGTLQRLLQVIWCRNRTASADTADMNSTVGKDTPVKRCQQEQATQVFSTKKSSAIVFTQVIDRVKDAIQAIDGYQRDSELNEDEIDAALE